MIRSRSHGTTGRSEFYGEHLAAARVSRPAPAAGAEHDSGASRAARGTGICALVCALLVGAAPAVAGPGRSANAGPAGLPRVLVLHSYHSGLSWTDGVDRGIREVLEDGPGCSIASDYLDAKRTTLVEFEEQLVDFLVAKHQACPPQVVIASDNAALTFFLKHRSRLFGDVPAVFCGINNFCDDMIPPRARVTGVVERTDARRTFELIRRLRPGLDRCIVIGDHTVTGHAELRAARTALGDVCTGVPVEYWENLPLTLLEQRLGGLDPDRDAVLLTVHNRDPDGTYYAYETSATRLVAASPAPIFGLWDFYIGTGVVGGYMASAPDQGRVAGALALRLLSGAAIGDVPIVRTSPNRCILEATVAERFGIDRTSWPTDAVIHNPPSSVIRDHWRTVLAAVLLMAAEALIILLLIRAFGSLRRRSVAHLRASEARFHRLAEQSRTITWEVDAAGLYTFVSNVAEQVIGYRPEELVGRVHFHDLHPEEGRAAFKAAAFKALDEKQRLDGLERVVQGRDGQRIWVSTYAFPVHNGDGTLRGYCGNDVDITERRSMQDHALQQAGLIGSLLDAIPDLIFYKDLQGVYLGCNPGFAAFVGRPREELIGRTDHELFDREIADSFRLHDEQMLAHGQSRRNEEWVTYPDGRRVLLDTVKIPYRDSSGRLIGILGISRDITERKRVEEEVRTQREFLNSVFDSIQDGVSVLNRDLTIRMTNPVMRRWHSAASPLAGQKCFACFRGRSEACDPCPTLRAFDSGRLETDILPGSPAAGIEWIEVFAYPMPNPQTGEVDAVIEFVRDISQRRRHEEVIRRTVEEQEAVFETSPVGIVLLENRMVTKVNRRMAEMLGYTREEILGRGPEHLHLSLEHFQEFGEKYYWRLAEQEFLQLEWPMRHRDGHTVWCQFNGRAVCPPDLAKGAVWIIDDITERRHAAEALRDSEARLRGITQSAQDAIIMMDTAGAISFWNPAAETILGYPAAEAIGQNLHELLAPESYHAAHLAAFPDFRKSGRGAAVGRTTELAARCKDGREITIALSLSAVDLHGAWHAVGILRDITEQKQAEANLRDANQRLEAATARANDMAVLAELASASKSEFLANMSHEIRTPMTAILGFAEAVRDMCPGHCTFGQGDHQEYLEIMIRNGCYLLELINDILDLSKIEAGKLSVERIACSPLQVIREVEELIRVRCDAKGLRLHIEFDGPLPRTVASDPVRLRQILINLLGNASKFTEVGEVHLIARLVTGVDPEPVLEFDVVDTGVGMSAAQSAALFVPFQQADASTTRRFGGTGLGLAISKRLAEALGGDVLLVETAPGVGSRFRVRIATGPLGDVPLLVPPFDQVDIPQPVAPPIPVDDEPLACRVLLAEDGPDNQRLLTYILQKAGMEVTVVENGLHAVEAALGSVHQRRRGDPPQAFDVILMDMQMPEMDGYTATTTLREQGYTGPIIALTAHAMVSDRAKCRAAGCDDFASKPVDRLALIELVRAHVSPTHAPVARARPRRRPDPAGTHTWGTS